MKSVQLLFKRTFDLTLSAIALLFFSPILLAVALLIRLKMGAPVFFHQERIGRFERKFYILKFRTMLNAVDAHGVPLPDAERVTALGSFLRRSSLDELPELWNVFNGDMSLVGPRPLIQRYMPYYTERERKRFLVRQGITGLAQTSGRNNLGWDDRFELDVQYVENWSLWLDIKILFNTVMIVFRRHDVVVAPNTTMLDFDAERIARGANRVE